jgi:hypothetical protein
MKVTKNYIKQLVKEELNKVLFENSDLKYIMNLVDRMYDIYQKHGGDSKEFKEFINADNFRSSGYPAGLQGILDIFKRSSDSDDQINSRMYKFFKSTGTLPMLVVQRQNPSHDYHPSEEDFEPALQAKGYSEDVLKDIPQSMHKVVQDTFFRTPDYMQMYRKFVDYLDRLPNPELYDSYR